ncbi:MAG: polyphosphate kinase 2 family protein [Deltaproteobacteria bacterium]|nr:polyphosphate kinase 2 family protein [Deltaproteobacteria bacterium]
MKNILFAPPKSEYLVPYDGSFRVSKSPTDKPKDAPEKDALKASLAEQVEAIAEQQRKLYADNSYSLLLVFQAMDAAGKDGTIRAVLTGVNPAGCQVHSFKRPSSEELDHDFLWRIQRALPERGRIGVFNRSHYEETLAVRVHPEYLSAQNLPRRTRDIWQERFDSIRDLERHLARNGTLILKFFLNVSKREQEHRLVQRIDDPERNWKFEGQDLKERALWPKYMAAFENTLNATSRPWAPWYAIPADDKSFMRLEVARLIRETLESLKLRYPRLPADEIARLAEHRVSLTGEPAPDEPARPEAKRKNKKKKRKGKKS